MNQAFYLLAATEPETYERLFGLDPQLIFDSLITGLSVFILFFVLSYLLFNPARDMLKKRQDKIQNDLDTALSEKEAAIAMKKEYESRLNEINKEAEAILTDSRRTAKKTEAKIIAEAKEEAVRIRRRAQKEIELEKKRALEDMKQEMIAISAMMAAKVVGSKMDTTVQDALVEETLKEIGDKTWQS